MPHASSRGAVTRHQVEDVPTDDRPVVQIVKRGKENRNQGTLKLAVVIMLGCAFVSALGLCGVALCTGNNDVADWALHYLCLPLVVPLISMSTCIFKLRSRTRTE
jgi:hypothetical protein